MPFKDDIVQGGEDGTGWEFDDAQVSCYTYLSVLGQGWPVPLLTFMVQICLPVVLCLVANKNYKDVIACDELDDDDCNRKYYCPRRLHKDTVDGTYGFIMILMVCIIYFTKVVPDQLHEFTRIMTDDDSGFSKLSSLRQLVWDQDEDTFLMKLGYRLDVTMNTAFACILCTALLPPRLSPCLLPSLTSATPPPTHRVFASSL